MFSERESDTGHVLDVGTSGFCDKNNEKMFKRGKNTLFRADECILLKLSTIILRKRTINVIRNISMENIEFGSFTDSRDGQIYKTVKIGDQVWLAENLRFKCDKSFAPDEDEKNVARYGYLYEWSTVYNVAPEGWHVPTKADMKKFQKFLEDNGYGGIEGITLNSSDWVADTEGPEKVTGKDTLGFGFLPAGKGETGWQDEDGNPVVQYSDFGRLACFWVIEKKQKAPFLGDWTPFMYRGFFDKFSMCPEMVTCKADFEVARQCVSVRLVQDSATDAKKKKKAADAKKKAEVAAAASAVTLAEQREIDFENWKKNPVPEFGSMTDPRNGVTYKTVKIGGVEWMAEDLRYANDAFKSMHRRYKDGERCYYNWTEAMDISASYCNKATDPAIKKKIDAGNFQGISPDGWHIPTLEECQYLVRCVQALGYEGREAFALKSKEGWQEIDEYCDEYEKCSKCGGEGLVKDEAGDEVQCDLCLGRGEVRVVRKLKPGEDAVGMNILVPDGNFVDLRGCSGRAQPGFWSTTEMGGVFVNRTYGISLESNNTPNVGSGFLKENPTPEEIVAKRFGHMWKSSFYPVRCVKNK